MMDLALGRMFVLLTVRSRNFELKSVGAVDLISVLLIHSYGKALFVLCLPWSV